MYIPLALGLKHVVFALWLLANLIPETPVAHQWEVRPLASVFFKLVANMSDSPVRHAKFVLHELNALFHDRFVLFIAAVVEVTGFFVDCLGRTIKPAPFFHQLGVSLLLAKGGAVWMHF